MKNLFLITALAAGLGAVAIAPASALSITAPVAAPSATTNVDCRTVEKRVSRDGVTRITKERVCDDDRRSDRRYRDRDRDDRRYVERRDRRDYQPGINLRIGQ